MPIRVLALDMFVNLETTFCLSLYVIGFAQVFVEGPFQVPICTFHYNRQILDFLNVEVM